MALLLEHYSQRMSRVLEVHLVSDSNGVSLASVIMREEGTPNNRDIVKGFLVVSQHEERLNVTPEATERLRRFGDPQRALLILLLRFYESQFERNSLTTQESPVLARSLFGIYRKQLDPECKNRWMAVWAGCQPNEPFGNWYSGEGSSARGKYCALRLTDNWKQVSLVVKINASPTKVPTADYEQLAQALAQHKTFKEPKATVTIDQFELLVWNGAVGCFTHGCDNVRAGDRVQLHLRANQPVYFYIVWLDSRGRVVSLYPWTSSKWEWPNETRKVDQLSLPAGSGPNDHERSWRVEGAPGAEHIIVVANRECIGRLDAQKFRLLTEGLRRHQGCPVPEIVVISTFDRRAILEKPTRIIQRLTEPRALKEFQAMLAEPFRSRFDHVLICSLANEGGSPARD